MYARQVAEAADKSLEDDAKSLRKVSSDQGRRGKVEERLNGLRRRVHDVAEAVERSDPESAKRVLGGPAAQTTGTEAAGGRGS
jgi:hypothetical protein